MKKRAGDYLFFSLIPIPYSSAFLSLMDRVMAISASRTPVLHLSGIRIKELNGKEGGSP
jgi:hypothetical protein